MIIYPYEVSVGTDIIEFSYELPEHLVSVFAECDRKVLRAQNDEDGYTEYAYEASVATIRDRLDIMGFTSAKWRTELEAFRQRSVDHMLEFLEECRDENVEVNELRWKRTVKIAQGSSPERWVETLMDLLHNRWGGFIRPRSKILETLLTDEVRLIKFPFDGYLSFLRAAVDMSTDEEVVKFSFTEAVSQYGLEPDCRLADEARAMLREPAQAIERILILTEGQTDTSILGSSLGRLFPHLRHMYSFLDHSSFKAPGGVSELERLARGLAGAGVSNRVVVLVDNDTAGLAAADRLRKAHLPANFRVVSLPDLEVAQSYPTVGPTGTMKANINGRACSIELYCGPASLTADDGNLRAVQWTSYDPGMGRYQGEPVQKDQIKQHFLDKLRRSVNPQNDPEFDGVRRILEMIFDISW